MFTYGTWNWKNCWRIAWILILLGIFFGCLDWDVIAKGFGAAGGIVFIFMFVIRFEDVQRCLNNWCDEDD